MISVIVPCFNMEDTVVQTLESVLSQTYPDWECVVVNDGSTDGSEEKIRAFIEIDPRFRLINTKNSGVSAARNTAVAHSSGHYLFPLDGDNYIHKDCLKICVAEFEKRSDMKLVNTEAELFGGETGLWNLPDFDYKTMLKYNMVDNSSLFLRQDFDRVGGYRLNMVHGLEDWDFFIALLYGCTQEQVVKIKEPLYFYRVNNKGRRLTVAASTRQSEMMDLMIYNNFPIYREYFPDIFTRIHAYDFQKTMLEKMPVKWLIRMMMGASAFKNKLLRKKTGEPQ
jgi:glycosyltransferase involved in cell wall biosynthesis